MNILRTIDKDVLYLGGSDFRLSRFENMFPLPDGVSYNSYFISDARTAVMDCVDSSVADEFLKNVDIALNGRSLDYVVITHMEPDHSATLWSLLCAHPETKAVMNAKMLAMFKNFFFGAEIDGRVHIVNDGDELNLGEHKLQFVFTPMVHWPEVMMAYESTDKILFSSDAFGAFGAVNGSIFDDDACDFDAYKEEMRRYYTNIVGKYGAQVLAALDKLQRYEIKKICPLHGRVLRSHIQKACELYMLWASYSPECDGVLVVYGSMYGHTKQFAFDTASAFAKLGENVKIMDVSSYDVSYLVSETFKRKYVVLACVTYNMGLYPKMESYLTDLKALGLKNRIFGFIENGSWAPAAGKIMRAMTENLSGARLSDNVITIRSAAKDADYAKIDEFCKDLLSIK
jgi:flavorubredoxin